MSAPSATAAVTVTAPSDTVYNLITDLGVLADLADETHAMRWVSGSAATPGARFRGTNRNGWRRWSTTCTITDAAPAQRFAFEVTHLRIPIARWQYDLDAVDGGCRVTESTWDRRPGWFKLPAELATGVRNRAQANRAHIEATLARLKTRAEA